MSDQDQVTSVGNSWILCKSKSHAGRVYYFNTLTGEAVWNLSDAEIEKAKKNTKVSICKDMMGSYPEPQEGQDGLNNENPFQQQNNLQIINNKCPKTICSCHSQFVTTHCLRSGPLSNLHQMSLSVHNIPQCNANIWALPSRNVLITPNISSNINQVQTSNNCLYNSESNFLSQTPSAYVSNLTEVTSKNKSPIKDGIANISNTATDKFGDGFRNDSNIYDLRQILSAKRKLAYNKLTSSRNKDFEGPANATRDKIIKYKIDGQNDNSSSDVSETRETSSRVEISSRNVDEEWLEQNICVQGTKLTLDVTCLKQLATSNGNSDIWYIVTDAIVLQNNLMFLYNIMSADKYCRTMVPEHAMTELDEIISNGLQYQKNRAQRAKSLVNHYVSAGLATIGKEFCDKSDEQILSNCLQLVKENYHVILLSNNTKLQNHKYSSLIPTFTVKSLQQFLVNKQIKTPESCHTIFNDTNQMGRWEHDKEPNGPMCKSHGSEIPLNNDIQVSQCKEVVIQTDITALKSIVDAQVQTDLLLSELENISKNNTEVPQDSNILNDVYTNSDINVTNLCEAQNATKFEPHYSRKEIRLKRNKFNQSSTSTSSDNVAEKKQFKWRRRRNMSNVQSNVNIRHQSEVTSNDRCFKSNDITESDNLLICNTDQSVDNHNKPKCYIASVPRNTSENIVIEETSTSGGISNTIQTLNLAVSSVNVIDSNTILNIPPQSEVTSNNNCFKNNDTTESDNLLICNTDQSVNYHNKPECYEEDIVEYNIEASVPRNTSENIVTEETSTSGVISNTTSNMDSESIHSIAQQRLNSNIIIANEENSQINLPIYEVNDNVAEHLKMKSDEWVSRFTQIMEEVLTQVLHLAPAFKDPKMLPPWSIHEASQCIIKKYNQHFDITKMATKLSNILFKVSDNKGKISIKLSPSEYMEMYFYGKNLVHALQAVLINCEDLQAAAKSLSRLLKDIENPNLNSSSNTFIDCFVDAAEPSVSFTESSPSGLPRNEHSIDVQKTDNKSNIEEEDTICDSHRTPATYNFRTQTKYVDKEKDQPVSFIGKVKEKNFFKSLELQKKSAEDNSIVQDKTCVSNISNVDNSSELHNLQNKETAGDKNNESNIEPKFIRKFNKCLEFEERLKNKQRTPVDLDTIDYSVYDEEKSIGEYYPEDYSYLPNDIEDETVEENDNIEQYQSVYTSPEPPKENVIRYDFKLFAKKFLNEIRETFLQVHSYCQKCHQDLCDPEKLTPIKKKEILDKTRKSHLHIDYLCKSLQSLLDRDKQIGDNTESLLKSTDLDYESQRTEYRYFVTKSIDQANNMLEILTLIINSVNN